MADLKPIRVPAWDERYARDLIERYARARRADALAAVGVAMAGDSPQPDLVLEALNAACDIEPRDPVLHCNRALALEALGDRAEASRAFRAARGLL